MAGIYIHIPFCRQACHYCDFHFSTSLSSKEAVLDAIRTELAERSAKLEGQRIETIYFGGGTPSLLSGDELKRIFETVEMHYTIDPAAEITLEANPDDLPVTKIRELRETPVNRFSIGVQSFRDEDLRYMNRAHSASQADYSIRAAQDAGFTNISIDLIYGTPTLTGPEWLENMKKALALDVPHISSYALTVEENTPLNALIRRGKMLPVENAHVADQLGMLMDVMERSGFEQYEISNFSKPGFRSRHNTSYWKGIPYIGIGPSAHSYDGRKRRWNIANNLKYAALLREGKNYWEEEMLDERDRYNEFIMISLRTVEGVDEQALKLRFGEDYARYFRAEMEKTDPRYFIVKGNAIALSREGKFIADKLTSLLFMA